MSGDPVPADGSRIEIALLGASRFADARGLRLRPWLDRLAGEISPHADSFSVRLVGDAAMRSLNRRFRDRDETTDVLSFPGDRTADGLHLGDVVISVPRAREQATRRGHPLERELRLLLLHGLLHCLGHDHESDDGEMGRIERRLRRRWLDAA